MLLTYVDKHKYVLSLKVPATSMTVVVIEVFNQVMVWYMLSADSVELYRCKVQTDNRQTLHTHLYINTVNGATTAPYSIRRTLFTWKIILRESTDECTIIIFLMQIAIDKSLLWHQIKDSIQPL